MKVPKFSVRLYLWSADLSSREEVGMVVSVLCVTVGALEYSVTLSIEWFKEGQAFFRSYDLAPRRPPPPLFPFNKLDRRHTGRQRIRDILLVREGEWAGRGAKSYDSTARKSASVNHSVHSLLWIHNIKLSLHKSTTPYLFVLQENWRPLFVAYAFTKPLTHFVNLLRRRM